jgi:hypothetical protein
VIWSATKALDEPDQPGGLPRRPPLDDGRVIAVPVAEVGKAEVPPIGGVQTDSGSAGLDLLRLDELPGSAAREGEGGPEPFIAARRALLNRELEHAGGRADVGPRLDLYPQPDRVLVQAGERIGGDAAAAG